MEILSPAKINRFLLVTGRRDDGYHEIFTLFEKITLFDRLEVEAKPSDRPSITIEGPDFLPKGEGNLVHRAASLYMEASGHSMSVTIKLEKYIPAAGGLGGGSSNAAAVLKAMDSLAGAPLGHERLLELAANIGADCPFFLLEAPAALGSGTGTDLEPLSVEPRWYLLVLPDFGVSTAWAYGNFELTTDGNKTIFDPRRLRAGDFWYNDLEKPVCRRYTAISDIKESLLAAGAEAALMSGSGSTVFGVFASEGEAERAAGELRAAGHRTELARSLVTEPDLV